MAHPARIMVVEDESFIRIFLSRILEDNGFEVVGPFSKIDEAMEELEGTLPHAAFLDINLGKSGFSFPLAEACEARGVMYTFLTGYTADTVAIPEKLSPHKRLVKPFNEDEVAAVAREMVKRTTPANG